MRCLRNGAGESSRYHPSTWRRHHRIRNGNTLFPGRCQETSGPPAPRLRHPTLRRAPRGVLEAPGHRPRWLSRGGLWRAVIASAVLRHAPCASRSGSRIPITPTPLGQPDMAEGLQPPQRTGADRHPRGQGVWNGNERHPRSGQDIAALRPIAPSLWRWRSATYGPVGRV